jgi:hypothetical protein
MEEIDPEELVEQFKTDEKLANWDHGYFVAPFFDADPHRIYGLYPRYMTHVSNEPFGEHGALTREGQVYASVEIAWPDMVANKDSLRELIANKIQSAILCVKDKVQHDTRFPT